VDAVSGVTFGQFISIEAIVPSCRRNEEGLSCAVSVSEPASRSWNEER